MNQKSEDNNTTNKFLDTFTGKFFGVLRWPQLDDLWVKVKEQTLDDGWYLYAVGEEPPTETTKGDKVEAFINELDALLRREHNEDYCGIVYANDLENPSFIKIFDPNNIGTSCSIASTGPLPSWVISKIPPINLAEAMKPTANRRKWWQKIIK